MTFLEHLDELRGVILRALAALVATSVLCFVFAPQLQSLLTLPFDRAAARLGTDSGSLVLLAPTEGFVVHVKLALFGGLILASPVIFWQIWRFVAPGLYARERRATLPVIAGATLCFLAGAWFGFHAIGLATEFFLRFATADVANQWSLARYIGFVTRLVLAFGLVFELPLVIFVLSRMGLVTPRTLGRYRRHAAVAFLVAGAVLTPPDPVSQLLLAVPVYLLFEVSILVSRLVHRQRRPDDDSGPERASMPPEDGSPSPAGTTGESGPRRTRVHRRDQESP
jgi:sec-independent protein translocase protein TatC